MKFKDVEIYTKQSGRWVDFTDEFFDFEGGWDKKSFLKDINGLYPLSAGLLKDILIEFNETIMYNKKLHSDELLIYTREGDVVLGSDNDTIQVHLIL